MDMITIVSARNKAELKIRIEEIEMDHRRINPDKNVKVEVVGTEKEFNNFDSVSVTIGVKIENKERK